MSTMSDLRLRVEKAEPFDTTDLILVTGAKLGWVHEDWWPRIMELLRCEAYESAVVALIERVMPRWAWQVGRFDLKRRPYAQLAEPVVTQFGPGIGIRAQQYGATPPLALLAAFLAALEAKEKTDARD